jgi:hypothetical protein
MGGGTISNTQQRLAGISLQTSAYGVAIPVVYGKTRVAVNLIYLTDFTAISHTSSQSAGGKGGVTTTNTTYTYTSAVAMGVCAGPVTSWGTKWADKRKTAGPTWPGWAQFSGAYGQAAWSYTTSKHPTEAVPYSGLAYIAHPTYDMGSSGTLRNTAVEVTGFVPFNPGTIDDANLASVLYHMFTDPYEGAGFPTSAMGDFSSASPGYKYSAAMGLFVAAVFDQQQPCRDHAQGMLDCMNQEVVWSGGLLKLIPRGDSTVTANGYTFVPNTTPLYDLTDDDFLPWSGGTSLQPGQEAVDPVQVTRTPNADASNQVQLEILDRANDYNTSIVEAKDQANIDLFGLRTGQPIQAHFIPTQAEGRVAAQLILQRNVNIRNSYKFRVGWKYALLEPMDLVTLTDSGLGLSKTPVRIIDIEEDDAGAFTVTAEEWPLGTASATLYSTQSSSGYTPNADADPGNANTPIIFEPPLSMTGGQEMIWLVTSGGANWGGADVWMSQDGTTYTRAGTVLAGGRHGVSTSSISAQPAGDDTTNTLGVDLTVSAGTLTSASTSDYNALATLCYLGGEILGYQTATLTAANKYNLTTLKRGLHGTMPGSHSSGAAFARLDQAVFQVAIPASMVGKTLSFKFVSFNTQGGGMQDISTLTAYTYTVVGAGAGAIAAPTGVTIAESLTKPT